MGAGGGGGGGRGGGGGVKVLILKGLLCIITSLIKFSKIII